MLNTLIKIKKNKGKRAGRGYGSGKGGHTIGRGSKGHKSRSGYQSPRPGFEGGQMPLSRRIPKLKGFRRAYFKTNSPHATLNLSSFNKFDEGAKIDMNILKEKKIISNKIIYVKVVDKGELNKKMIFDGLSFSKSAHKRLAELGCEIK